MTFFQKTTLFLIVLIQLPVLSFADKNSLEQFEIVVVESLSKSLNLNMSLEEIIRQKKLSKIGQTKIKISNFVLKNLTSVIKHPALAQEDNLLTMLSKVPFDKLLNDLSTSNQDSENRDSLDFMIVILPKKPGSSSKKNLIPFESLYSSTKASVIDNPKKGFQVLKDHKEVINQRLKESIFYIFNRNYVELESSLPFFVGALLNIHLEGPNSWVRVQAVAGLPTKTSLPLDPPQEVPEAVFTHFKSPQIPTFESILHHDLPGGVFELTFTPQSKQPLVLKMRFGNLAKLNDLSWSVQGGSIEFSQQWGVEDLGLAGLNTKLNVPHLFGNPKALSGKGIIDDYLNEAHYLKMNIHEVDIDLAKLEITNIRITIDLPKNENSTYKLPPVLNYITLEKPSVSEQFKIEGNKALEPLRDKYLKAISITPQELFVNDELRNELIESLFSLMNSKTSKGSNL